MPAKNKEMPELLKEHAIEMAKSEKTKIELATKYRTEAKVPIMVSPLYQPYFGGVMNVTINGIAVFVPVNGATYLIPETFADEVLSRIRAVDGIIKKQSQMADVYENVERSPGELKLF